MRTKRLTTILLLLGVVASVSAIGATAQAEPREPAAPVGTAFTYQGQLTGATGLINDQCDFQFSLWDAAGSGEPPSGGTQIGATQIKTDVEVAEGLFTIADLDFGSGAFAGQARWLQIAVRCPAGGSTYATLAPRQALTATPYALDAGLLDGQEASAFAGASHSHLGETWTGSDNPLKIAGSFAGPDSAALVLSNTGVGHGLRVSEAGYDGLRVSEAGANGLNVTSAGDNGVYVHQAGYGVQVTSVRIDGVHVGSAGYDGVYVVLAGANGLHVQSADEDGVHVVYAGGEGLSVGSAHGRGVYVHAAGNDGLLVDWAGLNGVEIGNAAYDGVQVNAAGRYGVQANTDGTYGFYTPDSVYVGGKIDLVGAVDPVIGERFEVDPQGHYEVGDLLVIDPDSSYLVLSSEPNDTKVIGVVGPGLDYEKGELMAIVFGWHGAAPAEDDDENVRTVAKIKADASYGSIRRGDLLTTSPTPGYAMKAEPVELAGVEICRPGTIIGKALEPLESGQGLIEIFVALQ